MSSVSFRDDGFNSYLFEYRYADAEWGIQITAKSAEEARERLKAISWAQYRGEVAAIIPIPGAGLIKRIAALVGL
jgi:hypothetical protein